MRWHSTLSWRIGSVTGLSHYLSQWWHNTLTHLCVTRPQHVYVIFVISGFSLSTKPVKLLLIVPSQPVNKVLQKDVDQTLCYNDVIMTTMATPITSLTIVYSPFIQGADQRKHQSSASLALCGEFTGDRWIPRTNGQYRGKCFHLMTSSCGTVKYIYQMNALVDIFWAKLYPLTRYTILTHFALIDMLNVKNALSKGRS